MAIAFPLVSLLLVRQVRHHMGMEPPMGEQVPHGMEHHENTPIHWWCAQPDHRDALACQRLAFKSELRAIRDPDERARALEAHRADPANRPSPEQVAAMRAEEEAMLEQYCALPGSEMHPFCARDVRDAMRSGDGLGLERGGGAAAVSEERRALDYDNATAWYCEAGGHPDAARHAASTMLCTSWRFRADMREAGAREDASERKAAIFQAYRAAKQAHKESHGVDGQLAEQRQMLSAWCALDERRETRLCAKFFGHKTELRAR